MDQDTTQVGDLHLYGTFYNLERRVIWTTLVAQTPLLFPSGGVAFLSWFVCEFWGSNPRSSALSDLFRIGSRPSVSLREIWNQFVAIPAGSGHFRNLSVFPSRVPPTPHPLSLSPTPLPLSFSPCPSSPIPIPLPLPLSPYPFFLLVLALLGVLSYEMHVHAQFVCFGFLYC